MGPPLGTPKVQFYDTRGLSATGQTLPHRAQKEPFCQGGVHQLWPGSALYLYPLRSQHGWGGEVHGIVKGYGFHCSADSRQASGRRERLQNRFLEPQQRVPQGHVGTPPQLPGKQAALPSPSTPGSLGGSTIWIRWVSKKKKKKKEIPCRVLTSHI